MTKKMKKQGGFTLVEMLIVVAIIAILIAVSIPLVSSALEKAREATDAANERAFKAVLVTGYLLNDANMTPDGTTVVIEADKAYVFDAVNGVPVKTVPSTMNAYGQSDKTGSCTDVEPKGKVLIGKIDSKGEVSMGWTALTTGDVADDATIPSGLVSSSLVKTNS